LALPAAVTATFNLYVPFFNPFFTVTFPVLETLILFFAFLSYFATLKVTLPCAPVILNAFYALIVCFLAASFLALILTVFAFTVSGLAALVTVTGTVFAAGCCCGGGSS